MCVFQLTALLLDYFGYLVPFFCFAGWNSWRESQFHNSRLSRNHVSLKPVYSGLSRRQLCSLRKHVFYKENRGLLLLNHCSRNSVQVSSASTESINYEQFIDTTGSEEGALDVDSFGNSTILEPKPEAFRNRFLNFARLGSIINNAAESFFKSEIRRRLFVTAVLIVVSRIGYFIPLPGFDRRLMPKNYLSFISGSVGE